MRTVLLGIRLTEEEEQLLKGALALERGTKSDFARDALLTRVREVLAPPPDDPP